MKMKISVICAILFLACQVQANTVWTEGHHEINENQIYDGAFNMYNDSSVDMYGGYVHLIAAYDATTVNLHNGHITELKNFKNSTANIFGGEITALSAVGSATVNWYDGILLEGFWVRDNSTANIYGGQINVLLGGDNSLINLYAYDVCLDTNYILSGYYYSNNEFFKIDVIGPTGYSRINIIPEPAAFMLLGLGGLLLRKRG